MILVIHCYCSFCCKKSYENYCSSLPDKFSSVLFSLYSVTQILFDIIIHFSIPYMSLNDVFLMLLCFNQ